MSSTRNNPLVWFERGSNGLVTADRFDIGVAAVQIVAFIVGCVAAGVGGAGVAYIHISQPTPPYLNCTVDGWVGGSYYVSAPYFLALAGTILIELALAVSFLYCCIKSAAALFGFIFLIDVLGHIGWLFYGSIFLRSAFNEWLQDQSKCSQLVMILSAIALGATGVYLAVYLIVIFLAFCCGCYFKCCGQTPGKIKPTVI